MKKTFTAALLGLLILSALPAQAAYNAEKVKAVMHTNFSSLSTTKKAIDAKDAKAATAGFQSFVDADSTLLTMNPPRGSKADWDKAFQTLVDTAKKGIAAVAAQDWDKAKAALGELRSIQSSGHREFQ